jgi:hypothetical protein
VTADDLKNFGDAFRRSPKEFDEMFARLLELEGAHKELVQGGGKPVYLVASAGDDIGASGNSQVDKLKDQGALLCLAGLGPAMRELRELHEQHPPADPQWRVPSVPWVTNNESVSNGTLLTQAQACLRLLQPSLIAPWATMLARNRLASLLLELPALMHPRFVWDFESRRATGRIGEPLPMVNAILNTPSASLPCPYLGFKPSQLEAFATHPLVAYALRSKSPVLQNRPSGRFRQGQTLAKELCALNLPKHILGHALLHIDRLRSEANCGAPLFAGSAPGREGVENLIAQNFVDSWRKAPYEVSKAAGAFLDEFRLSTTHPPKGLSVHLLRSAPSIFIKARQVSHASAIVPAADQVERFDRLVERLVSTGAMQTQKMAAYAVLRELFPTRHESGMLSTGPSHATVEVAHTLFCRWLEQGVELEELGERIRFSQRGSVWEQALEVFETECSMNAAIHSAGAAAMSESGETHVARARRNRGV